MLFSGLIGDLPTGVGNRDFPGLMVSLLLLGLQSRFQDSRILRLKFGPQRVEKDPGRAVTDGS